MRGAQRPRKRPRPWSPRAASGPAQLALCAACCSPPPVGAVWPGPGRRCVSGLPASMGPVCCRFRAAARTQACHTCSASEGRLHDAGAALTASPVTFGHHLGEVEIRRKPERKPHRTQLAKTNDYAQHRD